MKEYTGENIILFVFRVNSSEICCFAVVQGQTVNKIYLAERHDKFRWERSRCFDV